MKMIKTLAAGLIAILVAETVNHASGQVPDHSQSVETLAFHLPTWKSMHFDDSQKATQHAETIKKLGCEVKKENHGGHIDVTFRCAEWKTINVADHVLADQWSGWLASSGFDVSHGHTDPAFAKGAEVVKFRQVKWKNLHGTGSTEETQFIEQLKKMGCEVRIEQHNCHSDISFRAPTWRNIHLHDHAAAEQWTAWLQKNGFETDTNTKPSRFP